MTWTRDWKPTANGWYWYQPAYSKPRVVEVMFCDLGNPTVCLDGVYYPLSAVNGRWWPEAIEMPKVEEKS
jgi:hypothetical protein